MQKCVIRRLVNLLTVLGLCACTLLVFYAWRHNLFSSQDALKHYIAGFGVMGALVFVAFQTAQVVLPVLPGGLGCLGGVLLFGPWLGFVYNYVGICIGSLLAFFLARRYGKPLLSSLFSSDALTKYESWTARRRFDALFAAAIFFPVAPDDLLCYLAGTTPMPARRFAAIILLGKPASIALYSLGLDLVFRNILSALT